MACLSPCSLLFCLLVLFPNFLTSSESEDPSDDLPSLSTASSLDHDDDDDHRRRKKRKVGFHFRPDSDELINYYLKKKILGVDEQEIDKWITEIDILDYEPQDLPAFSAVQSEDRYWYFFYRLKDCRRGTRGGGGNSRTLKRGGGNWKATGNIRPVKSEKTNQKIGTKKTLVYRPGGSQTSPPAKGKGKGKVQSEWTIHEYQLLPDFPNPEKYVIVQLKKKGGKSVQLSPEKGGPMKLPDEVNRRRASPIVAGCEDHSLGTAALYENSPSLSMSNAEQIWDYSVPNQNVSVEQELSGQTMSSSPCLVDTPWGNQEPNNYDPYNMDIGQGSYQEMSTSSCAMDNPQSELEASICNYKPFPDQGFQMTGCDSDNSIGQSSFTQAGCEQSFDFILGDNEDDSAFKMLLEALDTENYLQSILSSEPSPQSPDIFEQILQPSQGCVTTARVTTVEPARVTTVEP